MKKAVVTAVLVAAIVMLVGCPNSSSSTSGKSNIDGIAFEPDSYAIENTPVTRILKSVVNADQANETTDNNIQEVLESVLPNGTVTNTTNGFIYKPNPGVDWELTDSEWDKIEDKLDDIEVTINSQKYEAEFELQEITGLIEVELDPIITYPASFTKIMVVDDETGKTPSAEVMTAFDSSGIKEYFEKKYTTGSWGVSDGIFTITGDAISFADKDAFEVIEEEFEDGYEEFTDNGKKYEFGLEEPFNKILFIEVELDDDSSDDDDDSDDDD